MTSTKIACLSTLTVLLCIIVFQLFEPKHTPPDANLNVIQIIQKFNYPVEVHEVTTDDGYILTLHRIPHGLEKATQNRTPVVLLHGMFGSAWNYVNLGPNRSLSFLLAEKGYDVWLGNVRGTTWSRKHKILNPDSDAAFWNYTLHEIGVYDIPAIIDYILETTNQKSLHYIGMSQGTTCFFIMASERVEYTKKIRLMTALSPVVFLKNPKSPFLRFSSYFWKIQEKLFSTFNIWELAKKGGFTTTFFNHICNSNSFRRLCIGISYLIGGYNYEELDDVAVTQTLSSFLNPVSLRQLLHLYQMMQTGEFRRYDYGTENTQKHGQEEPPQYDLSKVKVPVALYYSSNDWLLNIENMDRLTSILPNVVKTYQVPSDTFNHFDFVMARTVVELLYNSVIEEILKY